MAGKKDKPALYELIGKGPLKPDGRGSIETPKWFYGQKRKTEPMRAGVQAIAVPKTVSGKPFIPQTVKQPAKVQVEQPGSTSGQAGQQVEKQPVLADSSAISGVGAKVSTPSGMAFGKRLGNLGLEDQSAQAKDEEAKEFSFGMEDRKISLLFPLWVGCVVLLGLLFVMGVIYRIGQHSGKNAAMNQAGLIDSSAAGPGGTGQGGDGSTADLGSVPARPDVWDRPGTKDTASGAGSGNRAVGSDSGRSGARYESALPGGSGVATSPGAATGSGTTRAATNTPAGGAGRTAPGVTTQNGGWRLILCGSTNQRDLVAVQEYFNKKGIMTGIGKQSSRWVLYSGYSASSSSDAKLSELKAKVKELGAKYNSEKPRGATPFNPSTFSSAFPVKDESITGKVGR
ncbi:MAG: hypothetical protein JXD22_01205 [Sedimentisphaerales bacterium]|nr:hypothetical protein [Sedimentisphaerales bacterium]